MNQRIPRHFSDSSCSKHNFTTSAHPSMPGFSGCHTSGNSQSSHAFADVCPMHAYVGCFPPLSSNISKVKLFHAFTALGLPNVTTFASTAFSRTSFGMSVTCSVLYVFNRVTVKPLELNPFWIVFAAFFEHGYNTSLLLFLLSLLLSLIHIWRCRRSTLCRSRWSPYH